MENKEAIISERIICPDWYSEFIIHLFNIPARGGTYCPECGEYVPLFNIPARGGTYCLECGEYVPYGRDGKNYLGETISLSLEKEEQNGSI